MAVVLSTLHARGCMHPWSIIMLALRVHFPPQELPLTCRPLGFQRSSLARKAFIVRA